MAEARGATSVLTWAPQLPAFQRIQLEATPGHGGTTPDRQRFQVTVKRSLFEEGSVASTTAELGRQQLALIMVNTKETVS